MMASKITIVGGGLVGSLLACYLAKRGHTINVYERRPDMRNSNIGGGRSINLALSDRGWRGLEGAGIGDEIRKIAIPMRGRMIHGMDGSTQFLPYGTNDQAIYSVSRGELNKTLMTEAEKHANVTFHFNQFAQHFDLNHNKATFLNDEKKESTTTESDVLIGADGAYSELRYAMQKTPNFNLSQQHEAYGYKELHIPADANGGFQLEKNALHIWPRKSFMMIALPNIDGSFTCTLFAPFKGENSYATVQNEAEAKQYFEHWFASAVPLMPTLLHDYFANPTSSLVTVKCFPWSYKNTLLIGDAAHAIVPFYGQGMNCGFEDVETFDKLMTDGFTNWSELFHSFEQNRKPNSDAIADLALYNFIEMRDLTGQPEFQLRMKIEKFIASQFPEQFHTLYSMVTFSHLPYSEAKARNEKQSELLDQIMKMGNIEALWNSEAVIEKARVWLSHSSNH